MEELLNEELEKNLKSLNRQRTELIEEINKISGQIEKKDDGKYNITKEEEEYRSELEKIEKEINSINKTKKNSVKWHKDRNDLMEEQKLLKKDKDQLEEAMKELEGKYELKDGKLVKPNELLEYEREYDKVAEKFNKNERKLKRLNSSIDKLYKKYNVKEDKRKDDYDKAWEEAIKENERRDYDKAWEEAIKENERRDYDKAWEEAIKENERRDYDKAWEEAIKENEKRDYDKAWEEAIKENERRDYDKAWEEAIKENEKRDYDKAWEEAIKENEKRDYDKAWEEAIKENRKRDYEKGIKNIEKLANEAQFKLKKFYGKEATQLYIKDNNSNLNMDLRIIEALKNEYYKCNNRTDDYAERIIKALQMYEPSQMLNSKIDEIAKRRIEYYKNGDIDEWILQVDDFIDEIINIENLTDKNKKMIELLSNIQLKEIQKQGVLRGSGFDKGNKGENEQSENKAEKNGNTIVQGRKKEEKQTSDGQENQNTESGKVKPKQENVEQHENHTKNENDNDYGRRKNLNKEDLRIVINVKKNLVETFLGDKHTREVLSNVLYDIKSKYIRNYPEDGKIGFRKQGMQDLIPTILERIDKQYGTTRQENFEDIIYPEYYYDGGGDYGKINIDFNLQKLYKTISPVVPKLCQGRLLEVAKEYKKMGIATVKMGMLTGTIDKVKTLGKKIRRIPEIFKLKSDEAQLLEGEFRKIDEGEKSNTQQNEEKKPIDKYKGYNQDNEFEKRAQEHMKKGKSTKHKNIEVGKIKD